jgi:hypothetical protein
VSDAKQHLEENRAFCIAFLQSGQPCILTLTPIVKEGEPWPSKHCGNFMDCHEGNAQSLIEALALHQWMSEDIQERCVAMMTSAMGKTSGTLFSAIDRLVTELRIQQVINVEGRMRHLPEDGGTL